MSNHQLYVYSLDGTRYCDREEEKDASARGWETREEALFSGREHAALISSLKAVDAGPVWTGIKVDYNANAFFPDANALYESMSAAADGERFGLDTGDREWPDADEKAMEELETFVTDTLEPFLTQWVETHGLQPTFWAVTEVVKHADDDGALETTDAPH